MDFSLDSFSIGGILIGVLVLGIVEAAKKLFKLEDTRAIQGLAVGVAFFFALLAQAMPYLPEVAQTIIAIVVTSLAAALSAMGYYDLGKRFIGNGK